jgi:integrase
VLTLLLSTGARKSSVYAMRWQDVSFELCNWTIPMSKSGESYEVPLTAAAMEVLERRRREAKEGAVFVFPAHSRTGHINDIKKRWAIFRKAAGLGDVRLHDLRRTRGSYCAIGGESLQKIAAVLGHKSIQSTQIYARLMEETASSTSLVADETMKKMMGEARKRAKRAARKPKAKLLAVANG